jgi:hypothetical protein
MICVSAICCLVILGVAGEFSDFDTEDFKAGREIADHFLDEGFHGGNVEDLEAAEGGFGRSSKGSSGA